MALTNLQKATLYIRYYQRNIQVLVTFALSTNAEKLVTLDAWLIEHKTRLLAQRANSQAAIDELNTIITEIP